MKRILITLIALTFATACKAEESKQVTELNKRCEELSKETGDEYTLVSGVQTFSKIAPPLPCGNILNGKIIPNIKCDNTIHYYVHLENEDKSLNKIIFDTDKVIASEKAIKLFTEGKRYAVCAKPGGYGDNLKGVLETLIVIK